MAKAVIVEGIIAAGKTSLLKVLQEEFPEAVCIYEPVDLWESSGELQRFYDCLSLQDSSPHAYKFQTYTFITRIKRIKETVEQNPNAKLFFLERSIFSDRNFFVQMLYSTNKMNDSDYKMYIDWWDLWSSVMPLEISGFIYLNPSLNECMNRLKSRNRGEESNIEIDYQLALKEHHDLFLTPEITINNKQVPCLNLNTDEDFRTQKTNVIKQIKTFINCL